MDPTNNPNPTPTPEPGAAPVPDAPVVNPGASAPIPDAPVTNPEPPVVTPGNPAAVNPVFQPETGGLAATDPIMKPEAPTPPDPVEEELKAPMKAAGPVPGSIGSAVSGPQDGAASEAPAPADNPFATPPAEQTPSVSFSDPATEAKGGASAAGKPAKNKKMVLIILIVVAGMVVIALAAVLIMQLMNSNGSNPNQSSSSGDSSVSAEPGEEYGGGGEGVSVESGTLTCTKEMDAQEAAKNEDATSGTVTIEAKFEDSTVTEFSLTRSVNNESTGESEVVESLKSTAEELTLASASNFYLTAEEGQPLDVSIDTVKSTYESLDFTCEVL